MTKIVKQRTAASTDLPTHFSPQLPALLKRIYLNRGIYHEKEMDTALTALLSFHQLLHIQAAAELLAAGIAKKKHFLIIGDFDTDGATSTALGVNALNALGAAKVSYLIPNRFNNGYGLTPEIVALAALQKPDILITVDNGISSHEGVLCAKNLGWQVLITDHHLPAETLPLADVIINPNQAGDQFASKNLAGVGVIFYVMLALRDYLNARHISMAQYLDLVALGTVADVVPLDKNNRILVSQGLQRIRRQKICPGIQALLTIARRKSAEATTADLSFGVAPRLNAAGRLEDMSLGVACLLAEDNNQAQGLAMQLDRLNGERREIESSMTLQADALLPAMVVDEHTKGICLYHPDFHEGVIGILAGRLKDRYHRPAIVFAKVKPQELKGSARSIPGFHLRDMLALIHTQYPALIDKFGGHAMAAGLSIQKKNLTQFTEIFHQSIHKHLDKAALENILLTDGDLKPEEFSLDHAQLLQDHLIWGQGFPEPLFEGKFTLLSQSLIHEKHLKMKIRPENAEIILDGIAFNHGKPLSLQQCCLVYKLGINNYNGKRKIQLLIEYIKE